jgi:chloride channel protein, CIC family
VDEKGRPVGLVSRADALRRELEGGRDGETLGEHTSDAGLATVHPGDVAARVVEIMLAADRGRIPVVDPQTGVLMGLVTRKDLLRVRAQASRTEGERQAYFALSRGRAPASRQVDDGIAPSNA